MRLPSIPPCSVLTVSEFSLSPSTIRRVWDVTWLTYRGQKLINAVCSEKLRGARTLTAEDVRVVPILRGREGEDVGRPLSALGRAWASLRSLLSDSKTKPK